MENNSPTCVDSVLQIFDCKKPFRKHPLKYYEDGVEKYSYLTESGRRAYEKLISLLYGIGNICEADVTCMVETLDNIISSESY